MYIKNPMEIENKSMDIIDPYLEDCDFSEEEEIIVKRMIHTTGDFDYRHIISFDNDFLVEAKKALGESKIIYTDTQMAAVGINKAALERAGIEIRTLVSDPRAFRLAKEKETTRSAVAVDMAVEEGIDVFVFGNAPTGLFRLLEHVKAGGVKPRFVLGVPVGFVGAAESKEELRSYKIPSLSTKGYKGGSNVAASIINALLYMVVGR